MAALAASRSPIDYVFAAYGACGGNIGGGGGGYTRVSRGRRGGQGSHTRGPLQVSLIPEPPLHVSAACLERASEAFERQIVPRALLRCLSPSPRPPQNLHVVSLSSSRPTSPLSVVVTSLHFRLPPPPSPSDAVDVDVGAGVGFDGDDHHSAAASSLALDGASAEGSVAFFLGGVAGVIAQRNPVAASALAERMETAAVNITGDAAAHSHSHSHSVPAARVRAAYALQEAAARLLLLSKLWTTVQLRHFAYDTVLTPIGTPIGTPRL